MGEPTILIIASSYEGAVIKRSLAGGDYHVLQARGSESAEELLAAEPTAVILAHRISKLDSSEVLRRLRRECGERYVPVVLACGKGSDVSKLADAVRFGADHMVTLPVDPMLLLSRLEAVLQRERLPAEDLPLASTELSAEEFVESDSTAVTIPEAQEVEPTEGRESEAGLEPTDALAAHEVEPSGGVQSEEPEGHEVEVLEVPLPRGGQLQSVDMPTLLHLAFRYGFSGVIRLRRDRALKDVYLDDGYPIFASSNSPHDRLGELLLREGRIYGAQLQRCREEMSSSGRRLGSILVDVGVIKKQELFPLVRRHVADVLYSLFGWQHGSFALEDDAAPAPEERIRLDEHPSALIMEGIRRKFDKERLQELIPAESKVYVRPGIDDILTQVGLERDEVVVVEAMRGEIPLRAIAEREGIEELVCQQVAYGLVVLGLATIREGKRGEEEVSEGALGHDASIDRQRIRAKKAQADEGDYFAILGLRWDASPREVQHAHLRMQRMFAVEQLAPGVAEEHADDLKVIRQVFDEASRVLADQSKREAYRAYLVAEQDSNDNETARS